MNNRLGGFVWNHSPGLRWLSNRLSGALHHNDGNTGVMPPSFPVQQVPGMPQTYAGNPSTGGAYTNPNVDPAQPAGGTNPAGSTYSGNASGGTLGGGSVIDPSQWGALGLGGDPVGDSTRYYSTQQGHMSDGNAIAGGGRGLIGSGFFANRHMGTGGTLPPQGGYDSSGINPGGTMYTGGNLPAQQGGMQTGGALPPTRLAQIGGRPMPQGMGRFGGGLVR